ncbi:MAG: lytic murein transglycosylase [Candidatus Vogelbacteria bacterium]|nr:lytic murein transglycosylase [Candidatus Vogelbacteria bacterium]
MRWRWFITGLIFSLPFLALGQTSDDVDRRKAALEQELVKVEAEIAVQEGLIAIKQKEAATLERDRQLLNSQIAKAKLVIRAHELEIERLGGDINKKAGTIADLTKRLVKLTESLAELLRQRRDLEDHSLVEIMLAKTSLADFFREADNYQYLEDSIHQLFAETRTVKAETETAKSDLEERRLAELNAKKQIEEERRRVERLEAEKKQLLAITKNQQAAYRKVLTERERRKVEIKSALFRLRGSDAITFGEALDHANFVAGKTGVRPAFLMAVITQESNLGANVGTCNRPGDPPAKQWPQILKPTRDREPFLRITRALSLDPGIVPLSCPQAGGWGGAMGPAQFIPSTWELYQTKIVALTGNQPPNPWTPRDAFAASGIYLSELGAAARTWTAERTAALKYYAGSNWNLAKNGFYGNEVMEIAAGYQELIDTLQNS